MGRDLAIDLGTANTLVYRQGDGIVFNQPTVVALHGGTGEVLAMGDEVWDLIGGDSGSVVAVRPLRAGAMTEFDITQRMLEVVVKRSISTRFPKPRVLVAVPSMSSEVEKRAIEEAVRFAGGGRSVTLVEEPLAAAIGAGLPIHEPIGNLIVDIGGGRSEMAVVSMGGVVSGRSVALGGFDLDAAIQEHIRERYGVAIGETAAEEIKIAIGSAFPSSTGTAAVVTGTRAGGRRHRRGEGDRGRGPSGDVGHRAFDRRHGPALPGRGAPGAHARHLGDRDVPHGRGEHAPRVGHALGTGVRGGGPFDGAAARDGGDRRRPDARAPGRLSDGVPAGATEVSGR